MEFSISSYCMFKEKPEDVLEELSDYTKHVEWMYEGYHSQVTPELLKQYDFKYTVHAPILGVNLSEFDDTSRNEYTFKSIINAHNFAKAIGAEYLVIHPGIYYQQEYKYDAYAEMYHTIRTLISQTRNNSSHSDKSKPKFVIENVGPWDDFGINLLQSPEEIPHLLDFCLDVGHANLTKNLTEFLRKNFKHIHIHDNNGDFDSHLAAGEGNIDFNDVVKAIKRNNVECPVLECNSLMGCLRTKDYLKENYLV